MAPSTLGHCEGPCLVPPHPDYYRRASQHVLNRQLAASGAHKPLSLPTGNIAGLNDGTIFPPSHFDVAPSLSTLSRAALERDRLTGDIRVLVVLVDFDDKPMEAGHDTAHFRKLFFEPGGVGWGSVSEYYAEVSNHVISITGEVVGPLRMPHTKTYYANGDHGFGSRPNSRDMAQDALTMALPHVPDFRPYDNDHNGFVDAFIVVHAGSGAEETADVNDIWSLKWVLPNERDVGGTRVYAFLTIPEDCQLGVCCHELGHLLFGWPDLYDTDNSTEGIGNWCLMAGGSWGLDPTIASPPGPGNPPGSKPCDPSAWCKSKQGWVVVSNETNNHPVTLQDVKSSHQIDRLWTNGDTGSLEYFLLEYRRRTQYDASLPGEGLLVWHIDDTKDSNADESHRWVDLMQADGLGQLQSRGGGRGDAGDPYPGSSHNMTFSLGSNPSSKGYNGRDTKVAVTNIRINGQAVQADIRVR